MTSSVSVRVEFEVGSWCMICTLLLAVEVVHSRVFLWIKYRMQENQLWCDYGRSQLSLAAGVFTEPLLGVGCNPKHS